LILRKKGVKGMLPLGCLPLRGREGVTLPAAAENMRITGKEDFNRADFSKKTSMTIIPQAYILSVEIPDR
jgi:hypothetical protein